MPGAGCEQPSCQGTALAVGLGQGSAFQSKYLHSTITHGKEQGRLLPRLRGEVPEEPDSVPGVSAVS